MIVIDGFVGRTILDHADPSVDGILPDGDDLTVVGVGEILRHGLADERRHTPAAQTGLIAQLLVRAFREAQVRGGVVAHGDTTISRYRVVRKRTAQRLTGSHQTPPQLDPSWYEHAEIIVLETEYAGTGRRSSTGGDFMIPGGP